MLFRKLASRAAVVAALCLSRGAPAAELPALLPLGFSSVAMRAATWSAPLFTAELSRVAPGAPDVLEVAVPDLPDTAMAEMTLAGPVILYNPVLFRAAGAAGAFVRAHELGHVRLDHVENERMLTTDEGRSEAEAEADCFAARHVSAASVTAMVQLLQRRPAEACDAIYGTKPERVRRILACAGLEGG
jgi:hypothetical protein